MQFKQEFSKVAQLIREKDKILLASHERPDGDALGSMTAMFAVLKRLSARGGSAESNSTGTFDGAASGGRSKEIVMFSKDPVPSNFKFLPYCENIVHTVRSFSPELFLAFDYGDFARLGISEELLKNATIVTFDHHPLLKQRGDIKIIDESYSSTCELIYHFFSAEGYSISPRVATALLTGIFTDTGGLAHVNTSKRTLGAVGDLLRHGMSIKKLHRHTFSGKSPNNLRIWGRILKSIMQEEEVGLAYVAVSFKEFSELGASLDSFEGIVNLINTPPNVRLSLMLIEYTPGVVKGSLRSEPFKGVDVASIARALGGGGHKYAAGFERRGESLQDVVQYVKRVAMDMA